MRDTVRSWRLVMVFAVGVVLHAAVMGLIFGEVFFPYWWMAIVTGVGCAIAYALTVAAKQTFRDRRESTRSSAAHEASVHPAG